MAELEEDRVGKAPGLLQQSRISLGDMKLLSEREASLKLCLSSCF